MVNDTKSWPKHSQYPISIKSLIFVDGKSGCSHFMPSTRGGSSSNNDFKICFELRWKSAFKIRGLCLYGSDKQKQSDVEKLAGGSGVRGEGPEFFSDATATHLHQGLRGDLKHHHHHDHHHHHQHHHHLQDHRHHQRKYFSRHQLHPTVGTNS